MNGLEKSEGTVTFQYFMEWIGYTVQVFRSKDPDPHRLRKHPPPPAPPLIKTG
jgi:hypothetical protein